MHSKVLKYHQLLLLTKVLIYITYTHIICADGRKKKELVKCGLPLKDYHRRVVDIPERPEITEIVIVPLRLKLINRSAYQNANITRIVFDPTEKLGFTIDLAN